MPIGYDNAMDDTLLFERVEHLGGGMNTFIRASLLPPEVCQLLQNMVLKDNGLAETRPGILAKTAIAGATPIQGMAYLDTPAAEKLVVAKAGGWYAGSGSPMAWATLATGKANAVTAMAAGQDYIYISDGSNEWQRYDGSTLSAGLGAVATDYGDPPVGATLLCWHTHRMFASGVASAPDKVWASDLGDAGTGKWKHVSFAARIGFGEGQAIRALVSMQDNYLAVLKSNSVWLMNTPPTAGTASDFTAQKVSEGIGCVGRRAACVYGNDCLFMARDGVRSLRRMAGAAAQFELSPPVSQPIQTYIDRINWLYAGGIVAHAYRQYALFSVPLDGATANNAVLVWNGRLGVWVGVWIGWTPAVMAVTNFGDEERLIFGDSAGGVQEWQDNADAGLPATFQDNNADVRAVLRARGWIFGEPVNGKDGNYLEARFVDTNGTVQMNLYYDDALAESWTETLTTGEISLPLDIPFDLPTVQPVTVRRAIDNLGEFYEAMLEIKAVSRRLSVKTLTMAAYLNTVQNE
jgi:hypothetical protein